MMILRNETALRASRSRHMITDNRARARSQERPGSFRKEVGHLGKRNHASYQRGLRVHRDHAHPPHFIP